MSVPFKKKKGLTIFKGILFKKKKGPTIVKDIFFFCYYFKIYSEVQSKKCISLESWKFSFQNAFLQEHVCPVASSL